MLVIIFREVPSEYGELGNMEKLYVEYNRLYGYMPEKVCLLKDEDNGHLHTIGANCNVPKKNTPRPSPALTTAARTWPPHRSPDSDGSSSSGSVTFCDRNRDCWPDRCNDNGRCEPREVMVPSDSDEEEEDVRNRVLKEEDMTLNPTKGPSSFPTSSPFGQLFALTPSPSPGIAEDKLPTRSPSANPTNTPESLPTISPNSSPTTAGPTTSPSSSPTKTPSSSPAAGPTNSPEPLPSMQPSENPSYELSLQPSHSKIPTPAPLTATPSTSIEPTNQLSAKPSAQPTDDPTFHPTRSPTKAPSLKPVTDSPTKMPSTSPTTSPTEVRLLLHHF